MKTVVLYADRLPPLVGGMEMHAQYFIEWFTGHPRFHLVAIVTKDSSGNDRIIGTIPEKPDILFFNSGRWIEDLVAIREHYSHALFFYRTGGNEILKAPLERILIPNHRARQVWWATQLNTSIDVLVTNSAYTEDRLRHLGVHTPFVRVVGGVNLNALHKPTEKNMVRTLFCAARFVPYKNHALLVDVAHRLMVRGVNFGLRLAGDGPLLANVIEQVDRLGLGSHVTFLGVVDNEATCAEIASADMYVQFSGDIITQVTGGQYLHSEGMGRSVLEALSAGTFVVAGRSGALPEIVTEDRGLLVDLFDADVIAQQLEPLLASPPRPTPTNIYAWDRVFTRYEQLWEELLATTRRH